MAFIGGMTDENSLIADRSKLGKAKKYILTDNNGIPISVILISSASTDEC